MTILQKAEKLVSTMTPAEKAQVLQWVARDVGGAFPGIDASPNVAGGEPCIVRTRIPVGVLVQAKNLGSSEASLLDGPLSEFFNSLSSTRKAPLTNA
jgi:hypothetical protein